MIFNRVRLPVVSMTLSTPVLIQPEVTFVACVGGTALMNKSGSSHAREAFSASDKVIETTGSRTRLNIIGAIRLGFLSEGIPHQYKTVNGESIIDFFEKIKAQYASSHCINIVLDGAGYHRSSVVVEKAKELNIKLHYLPPYSPNLNPIERLWKVMNAHARNNKYFATAKEFRHQINHFFDRTLPSIADSLNERINDNFQVLSSAS
jgi:transposase